MRLEFSICTCYWVTHPPSRLAAIAGRASVGPLRAEISQRSLHSPSSSSRPSVPSSSFNPEERASWKEGPRQSVLQVVLGESRAFGFVRGGIGESLAPTGRSRQRKQLWQERFLSLAHAATSQRVCP